MLESNGPANDWNQPGTVIPKPICPTARMAYATASVNWRFHSLPVIPGLGD
jgi:hypothetical protein